MKITLKGRVKLQGSVKAKKAATAAPSLKTVRNVVRQEVRRAARRVSRRLEELRAGVRRDLRRELYSPRFAGFIGTAVANLQDNEFRQLAGQYLHRAVALNTTSGTVSGTLIRVGTDYVAVQESPSTLLLIPFRSVSAIRAI
ncbi:DUF2642 domain-containing protein [Cohnella caldifontis]|uniref:DUF2642 domain-containing protein n=1 Tax=Cohnella caldifontis TaxID=3027471 RepID=UPI0023EDA355|nr:DUF2642 domain-containing protein [Cohnella sp. YIM B05605]